MTLSDSDPPAPAKPSDVRPNRRLLWIALALALFIIGATATVWWRPAEESDPVRAERMAQERVQLDETVWAAEVKAQEYEQTFVDLWDALRDEPDPFAVLGRFPFESLHVGAAGKVEELELGIQRTRYGAPQRTFSHNEVGEILRSLHSSGYKIVESEWHHANFEVDVGGAPRSTVSFLLHVARTSPAAPPNRSSPEQRFIVRGDLLVSWSAEQDKRGRPVAKKIEAVNVRVLQREGGSVFREILFARHESGQFASGHPILVYDLNGDGRSEIVIPRWNRFYRNDGDGRFTLVPLFDKLPMIWEAGVLADFTGDGRADLIVIGKDGLVKRFDGGRRGTFPDEPHDCAQIGVKMPTAITAGDIDADGDLDLFIPQYKLSYDKGQMPTPIYDANDGRPAYLLLNDGRGTFTDATESAGLAAKRLRRTYGSSFVDLDDDGDLDLLVVSDYSGVDLYRNDGAGNFTDVTDESVQQRHLFGMGHAFGDYDLDGRLDFYAIGMSSTTARRLDLMRLQRDDRPDIHEMRGIMGYGNRMYLGRGDRFEEPAFAASVARTGWSWGTTAVDFDNDADSDLYVANGHRSGKSAQDYCTRFWCHDIYTGDSKPDPAVALLLSESLEPVNRGDMSWNGFEHNVLLMNQGGRDFASIGFLMGVAFEYDSRAVVSDDLDGDGRMDLLVTQTTYDGKGYVMTLHVYRNELKTNNHWIGVRLRETAPGFSPLGAKVTLRREGRVQVRRIVTGDSFLAQHANTVHFGLGEANRVERIEVRWPNGEVTLVEDPQVDRYHNIRPTVESP
jgi:hypothetical protein